MARMRAKDRRRQLLKVAAELFARRGYRGATTAELAKRAGVTEPILYRHFENKLDLFISLIDDVGQQFVASWREALEDIDDPRKRLAALLAGNPATRTRGSGVYRVILRAMAEVEHEPAIRATLRKHLTALHTFLAAELAHLQDKGMVRCNEPTDAVAWLLIQQTLGSGLLSPVGAARPSRPSDKPDMQRLLGMLVSPT